MPEHEPVPLQSWLEQLCRMIPGISQAVLLTDSHQESARLVQWPRVGDIHDDVMSASKLAANQKKTVTTILSQGHGDDSVDDMVIALPLKATSNFTGTLAILVKIKPSQQSVVMQILHWGEDWLQLLLQQPDTRSHTGKLENEQAVTNTEDSYASNHDQHGSMLQTHRSRFIAVGVVLFIVAMSLITGTYRVTAPASLEGSIQRVIVAPFDGYIANAFSRAGETVAAGEVIAELDTQELRLQQQRYAAEKNEHTRQYRQALAAREKAQAHIYKSQMRQADAQLKLLEKKIQRSTLASTLDGIIISGDLSRSLGAPVETGDVLFEVAPLDEYRLVIFVDEKQVVDVHQGLKGVLNLKALPATKLHFVVHKVSPVFEEDVSGIAYRVEAGLNVNNAALRPGMQGIAKIDIDQRSYLWIVTHELFDATRMWIWSWWP